MEINKRVYSGNFSLSEESKNNIYDAVVSLIHETNKNDIHNNSYDIKSIQQIMLDNDVFLIMQIIIDNTNLLNNENNLESKDIKIHGYFIANCKTNNNYYTEISRSYNDNIIFKKEFINGKLISEKYNDIYYDDSCLFVETNISNQMEIDEETQNRIKRKLNIEYDYNKKSNYNP